MKQKDARLLIGNLVSCGLYANGIIGDKPGKVEAELADMLKANRIIEQANKRARDKQQREGGTCSSQMTIADRGIAAMYVASAFAGGSPDEPNIIGYANGNYVIVISERHLKKALEDEA